MVSELQTLDSIRKENELLQGEVHQLKSDLLTLSGEIREKEKALETLNTQIEENLDTTHEMVKELNSQIKLLNIAKNEQKDLLRKYQRRRWTQDEKRIAVAFLFAVIGMSVTIAISNLTQ